MNKEDPVVAGLDLGSTYTKAAVLARDRIAGTFVTPTIVDLDNAAATALDGALAAAGMVKGDMDMTVSTGYGRRGVESAEHQVDEIYAKAVAAKWLGSPWGPVRT
ncbi:MAG: hypothetical protein LN414_02445, partial [Candidatus Thermoplasmatota archaeon]|nr:hypothetical protein [Candidatus Thermoplasmatota archaeon]